MDEVKPLSSRWITADSLLSPEPCLFWGAVLTGDGVGVADATLRDGHNTGGDIIITLKAVQNASQPMTLPKPIKCQKGLFCDVGSNVTGVLVLWEPI